MLGQGADLTFLVNGLSWGRNNALHVASRYGRVSIVSMLLGKGAVLDARNRVGGGIVTSHTQTCTVSAFMATYKDQCLVEISL
jgi:hypothetical protein